MKLSMWILADELSAYKPELKITEGHCILRSVRVCSDVINITKSVLYISENTKGRIMLANGHDMIIIKNADILDIFNTLLDIFQKYNEWETQLSDLIASGCSIDALLEKAHEVAGNYMILADASFNMYAAFGDRSLFEKNAYFRISYENNKLPLDALIAINKQANVRKQGIPPYKVQIPNDMNKTIARNLFVKNKHIGWLVTLKLKKDFTPGELQIIDKIGDYLEMYHESTAIDDNTFSKSALLLDIIEGCPYDPREISELLSEFNWYEQDKKQVYVFLEEKSANEQFIIDSQLTTFSRSTFQMLYHDTFVLIVNHSLTDISLLERTINNYVKASGGTVGKSPLFENIFQLKSNVDIARIAAQFSDAPGQIIEFSKVILPYIYSLIRDYSLANILHPALNTLRDHDKKHSSEFYKTLYVFLDNERNYTLVSKLLNIHRSTLIYRLERISELTNIDFDNTDERFHLLISFRLQKDT